MISKYRITELFIYPVKGMGGIALEETKVTERGFEYDRRWMLVDENNVFISQRSFPQLCLFKLAFCSTGFKITFNNEELIIPFSISEGQAIQVSIWNDSVSAIVADKQANDFFSKHLSQASKLVYMPGGSNRLVDKNFVKTNHVVSFADGYPVLIIGQASLNLLNSKLTEPVAMNRFRPNIVFTGGEAHQEDLWRTIAIADSEFKGVKACARCQVPNINQEDATLNKEPVRTLAGYRSFDHKINFGQNLIVVKKGVVHSGDSIEFNPKKND